MPKVEFIAESGKNFIDFEWKGTSVQKSIDYFLNNAKNLAFVAKKAGADVVKFQTHVLHDEQLVRDESRYEWVKFNESVTPYHEFWKPLRLYCDEIGVEFMTTPMSKLAAQKVDDLVKRWKVGSGNVTDSKLLEYIAETKKPVILSTGMSTQRQIETALETLKGNEVSLLYCKSIYPCPREKINLKMIQIIEQRFSLPTGFSDHTTDITTPMKAATWGAKIIEKHFTLDKNAAGPDHSFSLDPEELKVSIQLVRDLEEIQPPVVIIPDEEEIKLWKIFRT